MTVIIDLKDDRNGSDILIICKFLLHFVSYKNANNGVSLNTCLNLIN